MDCANGFDERHCHELEMNECDVTTEYRCLNGQCIDKAFYRDQYFDCMDHSDERLVSTDDCFHKFDVRCEDRSCAPLHFSCGDGHCYDGPTTTVSDRSCGSQRDRLYFQRMQPSTLILFSHVTLIYRGTQAELICYNESICPSLSYEDNHSKMVTVGQNGSVCRVLKNETYRTFSDMIQDVKRLAQSCSSLPHTPASNQLAMFQCHSQQKYISLHRLSDGYGDCPNGEDEQQNNTCALNQPYRFTCDQGKRCIHPSVVFNHIVSILHLCMNHSFVCQRNCDDGSDETKVMHSMCFDAYVEQCRAFRREPRRFSLIFEQLCDGIVERAPDSDGHTDESNCLANEWPCRTSRTVCNNVWNCPNGEDELGCGKPNLAAVHCNATTHFCLDPETGLPKCLSPRQAGDGIIHCLGSVDERAFCRSQYPHEHVRRYRCRNSDGCISPYQVCDCRQDCPENDDETLACLWLNNGQKPWCDPKTLRCRNGKLYYDLRRNFRCDEFFTRCADGEDEVFCELIDKPLNEQIRLTDLAEYPNRPIESSPRSNHLSVWHCNRGLYVRSSETSSGFVCLCPSYYYGDRCQFQRKRLTMIFQVQLTGAFNRQSPSLRFVVLLVRQNNTLNILSHEDFLFNPLQYCLPKYIAHLVYPIHDPLLSSANDSVHIHAFTAATLEQRGSWIFPVPFHFLPVSRIVKRLLVSNDNDIDHAMTTMIATPNASACATGSRHLGHDMNTDRDICVCPLNRIGDRCLVPFHPCGEYSCYKHARCVPNDERFDAQRQFTCVCDSQWFGDRCEKPKFSIDVSLTHGIEVSSSSIAFLYMTIARKYREPLRLTSFNRLRQDIANITFLFEFALDEDDFVGLVAFLQVLADRDHFEYYAVSVHPHESLLSTEYYREISPDDRCQPIVELFDNDVLLQSDLRRVKNYQRPCLNRNSTDRLTCFYDHQLICLCDRTNHVKCFNLDSSRHRCPWNNCNERGICVQNDYLCPTSSVCLCEPCSYGTTCQFSTRGYILSLDAILGSHVRPIGTPLVQQTTVVHVTLTIVTALVLIGSILNILAIGTFSQASTQEVGCGLYLLVSALVGFFTTLILMSKMILLLVDRQTSVTCSSMEFLLKWGPASCEWLNACVAADRTRTVLYKTNFSRSMSRRLSKWITVNILVVIAALSSPELIFRRMVVDTQDERVWCVLTLNQHRAALYTFYTASNILLFLLPIVINLISGVIIVLMTLRLKLQANVQLATNISNRSTWSNRLQTAQRQILKYKHLLLGPVVLGVLSLPRVVFMFIFVCTKLDQRPYFTLLGYLVAFIPSMAIVVAFVLPSYAYRSALRTFLKRVASIHNRH